MSPTLVGLHGVLGVRIGKWCAGESTEYCEGGDLEGVGSDKASGGGLRELNSVCKCGAKPIY